MERVVRLPELGASVTQAYILEWLVPVGGAVSEGAPLLLVEAEKVQVEVPAPCSGILVRQLVGIEAEVTVGDELAVVESP